MKRNLEPASYTDILPQTDSEDKIEIIPVSPKDDRLCLRRKLHKTRKINEVSEVEERVNRIGQEDSRTSTLQMFFAKKTPKKSGRGTFSEVSVMDGGCTAAILPTAVAKKYNSEICKSVKQIVLTMADGKEMAVDGVTEIFCKPIGCPHYKNTRFLITPEATDILIGFRDQVRLGILPQSYPCYLGEQQEECRYSEEIYAPDHPEDEADEENYDPHVHLS